MAHRYNLECLDRSLRDTCGTPHTPFGGKVVVLAGDFRQTLPVIKRGSRGQVVGAALLRSSLWRLFRVFLLTDNMRIATAGGDALQAQWYKEWLLRVGNGNEPTVANPVDNAHQDYIELPHHLCLPNQSTESLIDFTLPDIRERHADTDGAWASWISDRAILTPLNATVNDINNRILEDYMPGVASTYYSSDRPLPGENNGLDIPNEFLNTLNEGLPPHQLKFKKGVPVMLLRNIDPTNGLCNGTRLIVDKVIEGNVLRATVAGNPTKVALIPRIKLISNNPSFPFQWSRRQFPVRLAFAMTINKSQGQTLRRVGIDLLTKPVFCHGQLYVAVSRVGHPSHIIFSVPQRHLTRNVVYKEALIQDIDHGG